MPLGHHTESTPAGPGQYDSLGSIADLILPIVCIIIVCMYDMAMVFTYLYSIV